MPSPVRAIQIDASAHCQLACPSCPTATGATGPAMRPGHLDPASFQSLLDATPHLTHVQLSNYGQQLFADRVYPDLLKLLRP